MSFAWTDLDRLHDDGVRAGRQGVVGALIRQGDAVFAQRRSQKRRLFPGCWDLVGGHVEAGESLREALVRELAEETGWDLEAVLGLRRVVDWEAPGPDGLPVKRREFVLAVTVRGDLSSPRLEAEKATEGRWFRTADVEALNEGRGGTDTYVYDLVREELLTYPR